MEPSISVHAHLIAPSGTPRRRPVDSLGEEATLGYTDHNVIQHDFGFPRIVRPADQEEAALYAMLVSLDATRMTAERLMRDYPKHRVPCQAIVDFGSGGESDIRGTIAQIEEDNAAPWRQWRGGAT